MTASRTRTAQPGSLGASTLMYRRPGQRRNRQVWATPVLLAGCSAFDPCLRDPRYFSLSYLRIAV